MSHICMYGRNHQEALHLLNELLAHYDVNIIFHKLVFLKPNQYNAIFSFSSSLIAVNHYRIWENMNRDNRLLYLLWKTRKISSTLDAIHWSSKMLIDWTHLIIISNINNESDTTFWINLQFLGLLFKMKDLLFNAMFMLYIFSRLVVNQKEKSWYTDWSNIIVNLYWNHSRWASQRTITNISCDSVLNGSSYFLIVSVKYMTLSMHILQINIC